MSTLETERRRTRALEGLREASLSLTSKLEISAVLESILSNALTMVAADDAHIFLYDKNEIRFGAAKWAVGEADQPFAQNLIIDVRRFKRGRSYVRTSFFKERARPSLYFGVLRYIHGPRRLSQKNIFGPHGA